jgi:hypothetical protein
MNALVVLLMATSTTAADPVTVVQGPTTSVPSYSYAQPNWSAPAPEESRPRLFGRLRNFFNRRSSPSADQAPVNTYPTSPTVMSRSNVWGNSTPVTTPATVTSETAQPPLLRPVPTSTAPETAPAQRMPTGSPF